MRSFLVVDDEPIHRTGLVTLIKKIRNDYSVFEEKNGINALEFVKSNPLDIILTDIKMPLMNGLQFIEELLKYKRNIKIIVISGYENFDYAQKALKLGVFDYILKPFSRKQIIDVIDKAEKSIEEEYIVLRENNNLKRQLDKALPVYFEHKLNKWVKGQLDYHELLEVDKLFNIKGKGIVFVTELGKYKHLLEKNTSDQIILIKYNIINLMKEILNELGDSLSFFLDNDKWIFATIIFNAHNLDLGQVDFIKLLNEYIVKIHNKYDFEITIGIGNGHNNIYDDIKNAYNEAMDALHDKFYHGPDSIIYFSKINNLPYSQLITEYGKESKILESIRQLKTDTAIDIMNDIIDHIILESHYKPVYFIDTVLHILLSILMPIKDMMQEKDYNDFVYEVKEVLGKCEYCDELRNRTNKILKEIVKNLDNNKNNRHEILINKSIKYIEEHYMEDISLDYIAGMFYFTSNYFSNIFKIYTGINFSKFLLRTRIQKAKEQLKDNKLKIFEIASNVGYKDSRYFDRVFKKESGLSPEEFRRFSSI